MIIFLFDCSFWCDLKWKFEFGAKSTCYCNENKKQHPSVLVYILLLDDPQVQNSLCVSWKVLRKDRLGCDRISICKILTEETTSCRTPVGFIHRFILLKWVKKRGRTKKIFLEDWDSVCVFFIQWISLIIHYASKFHSFFVKSSESLLLQWYTLF